MDICTPLAVASRAAAQDFVWTQVFDAPGDADTGAYPSMEMLGAVFFLHKENPDTASIAINNRTASYMLSTQDFPKDLPGHVNR